MMEGAVGIVIETPTMDHRGGTTNIKGGQITNIKGGQITNVKGGQTTNVIHATSKAGMENQIVSIIK